MQGEYDSILTWPFEGTLKVEVDGTVQLYAPEVKFRGDHAFDRVTDSGISTNGLGFPKLLPHSELRNLDKDLRFKIFQLSTTITKYSTQMRLLQYYAILKVKSHI